MLDPLLWRALAKGLKSSLSSSFWTSVVCRNWLCSPAHSEPNLTLRHLGFGHHQPQGLAGLHDAPCSITV